MVGVQGGWQKKQSERQAHHWKLQEVVVGGEVVVKLSSQRYRVTVVDLLHWVPKQRQRE